MKWLKRAELNVLGYGLALSLIPSSITWGMGEFSFRYVSANNAYWMVVWNISVYMLMFFAILSLASTKEKTRPRLLAAGLGMILLGIFSATNCAELLLKLTQLNSVDNERTVVFGGLLQNICLYLSAAVGGGILASSIFAEEKITQQTAPSTQAQTQPIQAPPVATTQVQPSQQSPAPAAGQKQVPPVAATQVQPSQQPPAPAAGQKQVPPVAATQVQPSQQPPAPAAGQKQVSPVGATQVQPSQQPPAPAAGQEKEIEQGS